MERRGNLGHVARRPLRKTIHITCEGKETERNYLDSLKRDGRVAYRFAITVKRGSGGTREQIAIDAVNNKRNTRHEDFDEYWCVMDVEGQAHAESLVKALAILRDNGISVCLSNPSFEIWVLAHFERTASPFLDGSQVLVELNKRWGTVIGTVYKKSDKRIFSKLVHLLEVAIENARWVRMEHHDSTACTSTCNSSTDVYSLAAKFLGWEPAKKSKKVRRRHG
jgi:hypothetical protein